MALGHSWCTILLLLLGNNEKLPPVALDHRRPLQCCLKKDGSSSSMVFAEQQHGAGLFTSCKTFWSDLKYPVKHVLVYLNSCAERDCQMLWLLWAYERTLGTLGTPPVNVVNWELILLVLKKHDIKEEWAKKFLKQELKSVVPWRRMGNIWHRREVLLIDALCASQLRWKFLQIFLFLAMESQIQIPISQFHFLCADIEQAQ